MKPRHLLVFSIIWLITLGLVGLLGEAYLRWHYFALPTDRIHRPHPYLQVILDPSVEILPGERLDRNGLRKTGAFHAGPDVHKIVAIGDSCTFSVASSSATTAYPTLLEKRLNRTSATPVEVYNAGVPGYNTLQMLLKLNQTLRDIDADEVIIYGSWNDLNVMRHDRGSLYIENNANGMPKMYRHRTYWELARQIPDGIEQLLSHSFLYNHIKFKITAHRAIAETTAFWQKHGPEQLPPIPLLKPELVANFRNNLDSVIGLAKGRGAQVSIVTLATPLRRHYADGYRQGFMQKFGSDLDNFIALTPAEMTHYIERFNAIIRQLAADHAIELYDWAEWYRQTDDLTLFTDVVHPNDAGYAYLVRKMVEQRGQRPAAAAGTSDAAERRWLKAPAAAPSSG